MKLVDLVQVFFGYVWVQIPEAHVKIPKVIVPKPYAYLPYLTAGIIQYVHGTFIIFIKKIIMEIWALCWVGIFVLVCLGSCSIASVVLYSCREFHTLGVEYCYVCRNV